MSEFLDELARSLAKPMSRSRAVRVLGASLVAGALPSSFRTTMALGRPDGQAACPPAPNCDRQPGTTFCGIPVTGNDGCTRYIYVCCPTTGPFASPVCCKGKGEVQCCRACQKCGEERLPSGTNIICEGPRVCRCGPDITDALGDAVSRTEAAFGKWSNGVRSVACISLVETPIGAFGWEINQLGPGNREQGAKNFQPECATCTQSLSVQVGSGCHYAGSVNYVIYGVMLRLCHNFLKSPISDQAQYFTEQAMSRYITLWKSLRGAPNLTASLNWAKAGYNRWPSAPTPASELQDCGECPKQLTSRLTVRWLPIDRNI